MFSSDWLPGGLGFSGGNRTRLSSADRAKRVTIVPAIRYQVKRCFIVDQMKSVCTLENKKNTTFFRFMKIIISSTRSAQRESIIRQSMTSNCRHYTSERAQIYKEIRIIWSRNLKYCGANSEHLHACLH